jgi:hypothetical protein
LLESLLWRTLPSGKSRAELLAAIETTVSKVLEPNARSARHGINEAEDLNFFFEDLTISEPKGHEGSRSWGAKVIHESRNLGTVLVVVLVLNFAGLAH